MSGLFRIVLTLTFFAVIVGFTHIARAEYYMEFPEPPIVQIIEYKTPVKKVKRHYKKKHSTCSHKTYKKKRPRSHYEMTVTYILPICSACACISAASYCYSYPTDEQLNTRAVRGGGAVTYSYEQKRFDDLTSGYEEYETYDMRTVDDDVMNDPNMNNQYNQF